MRLFSCLLIALGAMLLGGPAAAQSGGNGRDDRAGDFDYYVLALSWQPSWCAGPDGDPTAAACRPGAGHGFTLHGLWPQYVRGWPSFCSTGARPPSRADTAAMTDIMSSSGLAFYQWRKHGTCSGLSGRDYLALSRLAYQAVQRPALLRELDAPVRVDPDVIEEAFLEANPALTPAATVVTCRDGRIAEVRVCLTRQLEPRPCTGRAARACSRSATLPPLR